MKVIILLRVQGVYVKRKLKLKPLEKYSEKPVLMEVIDYFRILKTFTIMNNVQNQNEKVLEEMLTGSNSDAVKTTLRGLHNFEQMTLLLLQVLGKLLTIPLSLCHLE